MTTGEQTPLLARADAPSQDGILRRATASVKSAAQRIASSASGAWPVVQLLVLPHLLGQITSVATAAEVDAMRSLSCAHYYYLHPISLEGGALDATSCQAPEVEVHFNALVTRITFSVVLANFAGMLLYGRSFSRIPRRYLALLGMFGCALARIPLLFLPLYQYPYYAPEAVRSLSPQGMFMIYWACAIVGGFSGATELVTLTVESLVVDTQSPEKRSQLFSQLQVAQLLGASIGPVLGSLASWLFPSVANRCFGYTRCLKNKRLHSPQRGAQQYLLFNTTPYWVSVFFAFFGMFWIAFVVNFSAESRSSMPSCERCQTQDDQRTKDIAANPPKYAWLGAFQRLVPVRISRGRYDARILQFTLAEIFTAMMNEGIVVLILILGFVFHWGRDLIALGLSVSNALRLLMIVGGLPALISFLSHYLRKPAGVQDLSKDQIDAVLEMSQRDVRRKPNCCPTYQQTTESRLLRDVSTHQRTLVRLWRAQVDIHAARVSYFLNAASWVMIFYGVTANHEWIVLAGAVLLTGGSAAQPMLRSAACTVADQIVELQNNAALPLRRPRTQPTEHASLPSGADSYLVIVSTVLLPCLLIGLVVRNYVYGATIGSCPGAFFLVVAGLNAAVLVLLSVMRPATRM
ncbi:uncharacterized protein MJAP1_002624 [Malassezia japonica]|uniref:Uncharacterized protein n=1 Tax=Malassezia japonica TaxID=223818 RepID=A0AAF0JB88_9BASI|nr:uncharacterized protein MJAP1_002624 [Malassezia japonica]WFD39644.1 hypothetical protein MJAP1_002624 [Malassezia japonica]